MIPKSFGCTSRWHYNSFVYHSKKTNSVVKNLSQVLSESCHLQEGGKVYIPLSAAGLDRRIFLDISAYRGGFSRSRGPSSGSMCFSVGLFPLCCRGWQWLIDGQPPCFWQARPNNYRDRTDQKHHSFQREGVRTLQNRGGQWELPRVKMRMNFQIELTK